MEGKLNFPKKLAGSICFFLLFFSVANKILWTALQEIISFSCASSQGFLGALFHSFQNTDFLPARPIVNMEEKSSNINGRICRARSGDSLISLSQGRKVPKGMNLHTLIFCPFNEEKRYVFATLLIIAVS